MATTPAGERHRLPGERRPGSAARAAARFAAWLAEQRVTALTFGAVTGTTAVVLTAVLETFLGLTLLTGHGLRVGLVVMAGWLGGIWLRSCCSRARCSPEASPRWPRSTSSRTSSLLAPGQSSPRMSSAPG